MQALRVRAEQAEAGLAAQAAEQAQQAHTLACTEARLLAAIETIRHMQDQACVQVSVKREVKCCHQ